MIMLKEKPNMDYIEQLAGDDHLFKQKFIAILQEEFPEEKKEYLNNINNELSREAALNVHKLKHKLNILGLHKSYRLAVQYEEELRLGDTRLKQDFSSILETIETYLKTI